ncbi:MAG: amidohydrolase family protein [Pirellulaceae bacterium]
MLQTTKFLSSVAIALVVMVHASRVVAQTGTAPDEGVRFAPPSAVLLSGAHVVATADREPELINVLIEDGKISAMGPALPAPAGTKVIDLSGKYLYPAFIDPLAEFSAANTDYKAGYWNKNVIPQRMMYSAAELPASKLEEYRKSGVAVVLAAPSDGIIKGQSAVLLTADRPLEQSVLRSKAFQHIQLYPARRASEYPNSPMGAVALIRQALSDADWYARAQQAVAADSSLPSPDTNFALEALEPAIRGQQTIVIDGSNELYALRADRLAREFSLKLIIRGSGREYRQLDAIAAANRILIIPVNFPDAPTVESRSDAANTTLQELMHWRLAPENPARLERASVNFVITADKLDKVGDLLPQLRIAIKHGLSQQAALHAVTQGPAELLEVEHLAGTLSAGKLANIIVANGLLFDEETEIEQTWIAGKQHNWKGEADELPRGKWLLTMAGDSPHGLVIELSGEPKKLKGKIGPAAAFEDKTRDADDVQGENPDDKDNDGESQDDDDGDADQAAIVELKKVAFNGYQLSGTFEADEIVESQTGVAILGATWLPADESSELVGTINWPDGTHHNFTAVPAQNESKKVAGADEKEADQSDNDTQLVQLDVVYPLGAYGRSAPPEQVEWLVFQNATIWTCGEAGILESADLLVHAGIIEAVGNDLTVPEGATIVDAKGMHISPGIIDCHSHMATDGGVNESGQAVTAEVRVGDFIDPNDITIYRQLAGGVTTSNILHGSANPIGGQNQVIKLRWGSGDEAMKMQEAPAGIKFALGENVKQSSRPDSTRYPQSRMGVEQLMRDRFEAALEYKRLERRPHAKTTTAPRLRTGSHR